MKAYLSFFILFFISSGFAYTQEENEKSEWVFNKLDPEKFRSDMKSVDSVKIAIFFLQNKEMGIPPINEDEFETDEDGNILITSKLVPDMEYYYELIADSKLTKKEVSQLNKYLLNPSSFVKQIALPETENIEIHYFSQGKIIYRVLLSAYTRNFYLFDDRSDERLTAIQMKKNFHHFIGNLLKKRKEPFWNLGSEFMFYQNHPD